MKPESRPSSEQGLASAVNLAGAFDHEFTQTPLAKQASFSGSRVAEVSALHLKRLFDNAGLLPSAVFRITFEVLGAVVLGSNALAPFSCRTQGGL